MYGVPFAKIRDLSAQLPEHEIKWRAAEGKMGQNGPYVQILAYIDARTVQDLLNDVCGPENWKNEFVAMEDGSGFLCGISILVDYNDPACKPADRQPPQWVTKWDGADRPITVVEPTGYNDQKGNPRTRQVKMDGVPNCVLPSYANKLVSVDVKGAISDSFKRAAVNWGVARELYSLGRTYGTMIPSFQAGCNRIWIDGQEWFWVPPRMADIRAKMAGTGQRQSSDNVDAQPARQDTFTRPPATQPAPKQQDNRPAMTLCPKCGQLKVIPSKWGPGLYCLGCKEKFAGNEVQSGHVARNDVQHDDLGPLDGSGTPKDGVEVPF